MIDYFEIENYTNIKAPIIYCFPLTSYVDSTGSTFDKFTFTCEYYDEDNNYPEYIHLQTGDNKNYSMYNLQGEWRADYSSGPDNGILYSVDIIHYNSMYNVGTNI